MLDNTILPFKRRYTNSVVITLIIITLIIKKNIIVKISGRDEVFDFSVQDHIYEILGIATTLSLTE